MHLVDPLSLQSEGRIVPEYQHPQRRQRRILERHLAAVAHRPKLVRPAERLADRVLLRPEVHRGPQTEFDLVGPSISSYIMCTVFCMCVRNTRRLEHDAVDLEAPDRQAGLEPEPDEELAAVRTHCIARAVHSADLVSASVA